jgi:PAS domain S-box-containing protein
VDSSPVGIVIGEDHRIVDANEALLRVVGRARDALVRDGIGRWPVIPSEATAAPEGVVVSTGGEPGPPREAEVVRDDGTRVPILLSSVFLDEARRQWASFVLDLTEPRRAEAERQLRTAAEAASRAKDEFLAIVSHELRTPLGAVLTSVRALRSGRLPAEDAEREFERVERNTQLQIRLIDDLLDLSRIVAGKLQIRREPVVLARIVEHAVAALAPAAEGQGVKLAAGLASGVVVVGDPERLQQIALNLVGNAVKFTPAGGHVTVTVAEHACRAVLAVRDTGRGIEPGLLSHIFEPFHQGAGERRDAGLGLGLAIVRRLVEAHGGTVRAESPGLGGGSLVTVELPAVPGSG